MAVMPDPERLSTAVTRLLGIDHPVLLAPMGGVAGGALAGAVTAGGGLGLIGAGYADPAVGWGSDDWIRGEFEKAGNRAVGVGFITWALDKRPAALDVALEMRPRAVMLSFGDVAPFAAKIRDAGAVLICQVQTLKDAREAAAKGAQIVVAQGTEAGGHGADRATLPLVPAVVDAVSPVPVAAAGGIADGRGLAAALTLGAGAALIGTRFWATPEALGHANQKALIERSGGDDTLRTRVFDTARGIVWPEPWTGRAIRNTFSGDMARPRRRAARGGSGGARTVLRRPARRRYRHGGHLRRRRSGPDRRPARRRRPGPADRRRSRPGADSGAAPGIAEPCRAAGSTSSSSMSGTSSITCSC